MAQHIRPVFVTAAERERESWDVPGRGSVSWFTLLSGDITPTDRFSAGIAEFEPQGGDLKPHRHSHPEIYYILEGSGHVTIDGMTREVSAGTTVFIPGDAEHGVVNTSNETLRLFYVFATDRFSDVIYRFPDS